MLIAAAFLLLQVGRRFGHAAGLAMATASLCAVQVACIVWAAWLGRGGGDDASGYGAWPAREASWAETLGAVGAISYVYVPCFVTIDVMHEMKAPGEMRRALGCATLYMVGLYLLVGLAPPLYFRRAEGGSRRRRGRDVKLRSRRDARASGTPTTGLSKTRSRTGSRARTRRLEE